MRKAISETALAGAMAARPGQRGRTRPGTGFQPNEHDDFRGSAHYKGRAAVRAVDRRAERPLDPLLLLGPVKNLETE